VCENDRRETQSMSAKASWPVLLGNPLAALAEWTTSVVENLGYIGVAALLALENLVPPIPSELILPLAGFLVEQGRFNFPLVVLAATIGADIGALILYALGRSLGADRFRTLAEKIPLLGGDDIDRARDLFERHGGAAVFFGRLLPGIRSVVSIPAGFEHMPLWQFLAYTTAGSATWNTALITAGWALGTQWQRVNQYADIAGYLLLALLALALLRRAWRKHATA
jgi:membrane protein DedA with SNARE-associated domain